MRLKELLLELITASTSQEDDPDLFASPLIPLRMLKRPKVRKILETEQNVST
jgi:hypothetical protein